MIYQQLKNSINGQIIDNQIYCVTTASFIPFDPANTDYVNFKYQINHDEAQLEDADGNLMTPEEAKAYVATLP